MRATAWLGTVVLTSTVCAGASMTSLAAASSIGEIQPPTLSVLSFDARVCAGAPAESMVTIRWTPSEVCDAVEPKPVQDPEAALDGTAPEAPMEERLDSTTDNPTTPGPTAKDEPRDAAPLPQGDVTEPEPREPGLDAEDQAEVAGENDDASRQPSTDEGQSEPDAVGDSNDEEGG